MDTVKDVLNKITWYILYHADWSVKPVYQTTVTAESEQAARDEFAKFYPRAKIKDIRDYPPK